jgi:hypothetical protein
MNVTDTAVTLQVSDGDKLLEPDTTVVTRTVAAILATLRYATLGQHL